MKGMPSWVFSSINPGYALGVASLLLVAMAAGNGLKRRWAPMGGALFGAAVTFMMGIFSIDLDARFNTKADAYRSHGRSTTYLKLFVSTNERNWLIAATAVLFVLALIQMAARRSLQASVLLAATFCGGAVIALGNLRSAAWHAVSWLEYAAVVALLFGVLTSFEMWLRRRWDQYLQQCVDRRATATQQGVTTSVDAV